jgi:hypothetical protein
MARWPQPRRRAYRLHFTRFVPAPPECLHVGSYWCPIRRVGRMGTPARETQSGGAPPHSKMEPPLVISECSVPAFA